MAEPSDIVGRLNSARLLATLSMAWERLWPVLLPVLGVIALFLIASWFGMWPALPDALRWAALALFGTGFLAALLPLRAFRWPEDNTVNTRVETVSALQHRPVTAQSDVRADVTGSSDPFAKALWQEHQKRMANGLDNLKSGTPVPKVAAKDPWALRTIVAIVLFVALFAGRDNLVGHIGDAFRSHAQTSIVTGRIDAWIKPPAYTNKPPLFLSRAGGTGSVVEGTVTVPEGSELVIRVLDLENPSVKLAANAGETDVPQFVPEAKDGDPKPVSKSATKTETKPTSKPTGSAIYKTTLTETGSVALLSGKNEISNWAFVITPDQDPSIRFLDDPKPSTRGALEFSYEVEDDYGVAIAKADIKSLAPFAKDARPLVEAPDIPLSLPSRRKKKSIR